MSPFTCLTLILTTLSLTALGEPDTLVYRSAFEEKILREAASSGNNKDLLALYSVINTDSAAITPFQRQLNAFFSELDPKVDAAKAAKQKVRIIFKEVHDHFLTRYEEHVSFDRIFQDGTYNCVTGSMLYSVVLKRYGIPYDIKEKPTHVYVVAFPGTENILLETTNPKGFYVPDEKQKKAFVDALVAGKFTTADYVQRVGYAKAFNEFYYDSDNISEVELAALQYLNYALAEYRDDNAKAAVANILKTNLLFPSPKHQYLSLEIISSALKNSKFDNTRDIMYMCEYANACRDVADRKNAVSIFRQILDERLIQNNDEVFVTNAFDICREKIRDSTLLREISFDYHYSMAYSAHVRSELDKVMEFAEQAYKLNTKNVHVHDLILRTIMMKTAEIPDRQKAKTIEDYAVSFSFLKTNKTYRSLLIYAYAFESYTYFSKNLEADGYAFMKKAQEEMKTSWNKLPMIDELIGLMYAEAGAYHFRKQQYEKAKEILLEGLKIAPNHEEIRARLEIVENEAMRPPSYKK